MPAPPLTEPEWADGFVVVFDSGVGGLSIFREIVRALPPVPLVYVADQAHMPYGPQPAEQIHRYVDAITRHLIDAGARAVVLACHSASATSLHRLRFAYPDVPFIGLEPAVKPAAEATRTGVIGVLATQVTADSPLYHSVVQRFASHLLVITRPAPELVTLVERGELNDAAAHEAVSRALEAMNEAGADQLVLACTHFPFLEPIIRQHTRASLVDPAQGVARQTARVLPDDLPQDGRRLYLTSGDVGRFRTQVARLTGENDAIVRPLDVAP